MGDDASSVTCLVPTITASRMSMDIALHRIHTRTPGPQIICDDAAGTVHGVQTLTGRTANYSSFARLIALGLTLTALSAHAYQGASG